MCVWNIWKDVKLLTCKGTQHFTGTVSNEATGEMGYPVWPTGRTCSDLILRHGEGPSQEPYIWQFHFIDGMFLLIYGSTSPVSHRSKTPVRFLQSNICCSYLFYSFCRGEGLSREPYIWQFSVHRSKVPVWKSLPDVWSVGTELSEPSSW